MMSCLTRAIMSSFPSLLYPCLANTADVPPHVHTIEEEGQIFAISKGCLVAQILHWMQQNAAYENNKNAMK